jgi:mRNA interferase MazF
MIPKCEPGTVVLVSFPFTDHQSSKVRPALVLSSKGEDVIILGIFSKVPDLIRESWIKLDEQMEEFTHTGLKKASILKTEKITVIHQSLIKKRIGVLPTRMLEHVRKVLLKTLEIQ